MQKHIRSAIASIEAAIAEASTVEPPPSLDVAAKLTTALVTLRELVVETTGDERLAALVAKYSDLTDKRKDSLARAIALGAADDTLTVLAEALRLNSTSGDKLTVVIPANRLENLSRGKGWCRKGRGDSAEWGERTDNGYRVGPGRWLVHGSDGFSRTKEDTWTVKHVAVGSETWTVAS